MIITDRFDKDWRFKMNCKRVLAAIFTLTLIINSQPLNAQSSWQDDGIHIRQAHQIEWFRGGEMRKEGENAGEVAWVWSDCRNGDRGVFSQWIGVDGNPRFEDNGIKIADLDGRQEDPGVWPDADGGWFYAWEDFSVDSLGDIYCTKINADGERVWNINGGRGVPVVVHAGIQEDVRIVGDGQGGCIIAWRDMRGGDTGDLYAMHILNDGRPDPDWEANGIVIVAEPGAQTSHTADIDGAGGMIIGWKDGRIVGNADIWAQRISPNGDLHWGDGNGIPICNQEDVQETPKVCPDGAGGAFFCWVDERNAEDTNKDIYMQRVNQDGELMWNNADAGVPLVTAIREQISNRIVLTEAGTVIVQWEDNRGNGQEYDVYAMRVNGVDAMVKQWEPADGKPVVIADRNQTQARVYPDGEGGIYSIWEEEREHPYPNLDIWGQRLNVNGDPVWEENGIRICTSDKLQALPLVRNHARGVTMAWADQRNGSLHMYGHLLSPNGEPIWDEDGRPLCQGLSGNSIEPQLFPRISGDNTFAVMWLDGRLGGQGEYPFVQYCTSFDETMNIELFENGTQVLTDQIGGCILPDAADVGGGELMVVWEDHRRGQPYSIYAQIMTEDGDRSFIPQGRRVAEFDYDQNSPKVAADGVGGGIIVWRAPTDDDWYDIYIQRISADGRDLWGENGILLTGNQIDETVEEIISDGEGGAIIVWKKDDDDTDFDLWIQRVSADGDLLWGDGEGLPLSAEEYKQQNAEIVLHPDGYVAVWRDARYDEGDDIFGQFIMPNGEFAWSDEAIICDADLNQINPAVTIDSDNKIWVVWEDNRWTGTSRARDIYGQRLDTATNERGDPNILLLNNGSAITNGIPICGANGTQSNPKVIDNGRTGVFVVWEDYRANGIHSDVIGIEIGADGMHIVPWEEHGSIICNAFHKQNFPLIGLLSEDGSEGASLVWEDKRATGKEELSNIFVQRIHRDDFVSVEIEQPMNPSGFALESIYPNPFNSMSLITFVVPYDSEVKLALFDVSGRELMDLSSGYYSAGRHVALLNGSSLASGAYFVRFAAGGIHIEQRVTFLK